MMIGFLNFSTVLTGVVRSNTATIALPPIDKDSFMINLLDGRPSLQRKKFLFRFLLACCESESLK
jgi:hypothetical protein